MKKIIITLYSLVLLMFLSVESYAQLNPLAAQYFNSPYLGNPAYAGIDSNLSLGLSYRKLWNNIPGSPEVQNLIAVYGMKRVGLGLNVNLDKAGLQRQSRVVGTYAYHLPLNDHSKLHFGVSLGFMNQRLSDGDINGNANDPLVSAYNQRQTYIDGDFGVAYTSNGLKLEGAIPNLNSFFKRTKLKLADVAVFYSAVSYEFLLGKGLDGMSIEPKLAYRGIRGFDNIVDIGANLTLAKEQVMLMAMYHSSKSASFGIGLDFKRRYLISGAYTTQTSTLSSYTNGSFELALRLRLGK